MLFYLKPLPLTKDFLKENAKTVSVTMIAKNEKMTPKISCPFTHFSEIELSEIAYPEMGHETKL